MYRVKCVCFFTVAAVLLGAASVSVRAEEKPAGKEDRSEKQQPSADQQPMEGADAELTRKIRRSIVDDKSLSTYARNVTIVSQDGIVTLKGSVRSEQEKMAVEAKAVEVAGRENVKSELSVTKARRVGRAK